MTPEEIEFLDVADVLLIHEEQLREFGGASGVRDPGALESAVAMPRATFDGEFLHRDVFEMAAAYAFHITANHPFIDGNKRAALMAALVFLDLNGTVLDNPDLDDRLYDVMIAVASGQIEKPGLAAFFRDVAAE